MANTGTTRLSHIVEVIFQQLLAVFVILILWDTLNRFPHSSLHGWHIVLCTLGVALFMAEAVQIYSKNSLVTFGSNRESNLVGHVIVMIIAMILVSVGNALKILDNINRSNSHFQHTHSLLALISWIMSFITLLGGIGAAKYVSIPISLRIQKVLHIFMGVSAYVIAIISLGYGIRYMQRGLSDNATYFLMGLMVIYVTYSVVTPVKSLLNHVFN